ncbi:MAG: hypothetical protein AAB336_03370 [Acidobacteriota bacterium]
MLIYLFLLAFQNAETHCKVSGFANLIDEFSNRICQMYFWQILVNKDAFKNELVGWTLEVGRQFVQRFVDLLPTIFLFCTKS